MPIFDFHGYFFKHDEHVFENVSTKYHFKDKLAEVLEQMRGIWRSWCSSVLNHESSKHREQ